MHCKGACMKPLLDVLMILDALEKEGSFAAASAKLYKTPSALSYTVHKLESDLNIQLLDRSGHRAKFTAEKVTECPSAIPTSNARFGNAFII